MLGDKHRLTEQEMLEIVFIGVRRGDSFIVITDKEVTYQRELSWVSGKGQKSTLYKPNTHCLIHPLPILPFDTSFHCCSWIFSCLSLFVLFPHRLLVLEHCDMDLIGAISATGVVITCRFHTQLLVPGWRTLFGHLGQLVLQLHIYSDQRNICCLSFTTPIRCLMAQLLMYNNCLNALKAPKKQSSSVLSRKLSQKRHAPFQ